MGGHLSLSETNESYNPSVPQIVTDDLQKKRQRVESEEVTPEAKQIRTEEEKLPDVVTPSPVILPLVTPPPFPDRVTIYVLRLEQNKYYVGKTGNNVHERYKQHQEGRGSTWTQLYKPISMIEWFDDRDGYDEDAFTKRYMATYGIENVRGGAYCTVELDRQTISFLQREIRACLNQCLNCGSREHWVNECTMPTIDMEERLYFVIDWKDKDKAKALKCRWDPNRKLWYAVLGKSDIKECLAKWKVLPER